MTKSFLLIGVFSLLVACSSKPPKTYDVTTVQSVSYSLLELADLRRQAEQFERALALYQDSIDYAQLRNDKYIIGLAKLKQAGVYLKLGKPEKSEALISEVEELEEFESIGLIDSIKYVRAQYLKQIGNKSDALKLVQEISSNIPADTERYYYYQTVRWVYSDPSVSTEQIIQNFDKLSSLKAQGKLENIEIYSYCLSKLSKQLVQSNDSRAESFILNAIEHFSSLELSNQISHSYRLAADYYSKNSQPEKSLYFVKQADNIDSLKVN